MTPVEGKNQITYVFDRTINRWTCYSSRELLVENGGRAAGCFYCDSSSCVDKLQVVVCFCKPRLNSIRIISTRDHDWDRTAAERRRFNTYSLKNRWICLMRGWDISGNKTRYFLENLQQSLWRQNEVSQNMIRTVTKRFFLVPKPNRTSNTRCCNTKIKHKET